MDYFNVIYYVVATICDVEVLLQLIMLLGFSTLKKIEHIIYISIMLGNKIFVVKYRVYCGKKEKNTN